MAFRAGSQARMWRRLLSEQSDRARRRRPVEAVARAESCRRWGRTLSRRSMLVLRWREGGAEHDRCSRVCEPSRGRPLSESTGHAPCSLIRLRQRLASGGAREGRVLCETRCRAGAGHRNGTAWLSAGRPKRGAGVGGRAMVRESREMLPPRGGGAQLRKWIEKTSEFR